MKLDVKKISIAMARNCFSVNDIVEKTKIGRTTVSKIINGRKEPSLKFAGLIARALNVDITDLLADDVQ